MGFSIFGIFHTILFNAVSIIAVLSHLKAMTTDPGAVPKGAVPLADDQQEIDYRLDLMAEGKLTDSDGLPLTTELVPSTSAAVSGNGGSNIGGVGGGGSSTAPSTGTASAAVTPNTTAPLRRGAK